MTDHQLNDAWERYRRDAHAIERELFWDKWLPVIFVVAIIFAAGFLAGQMVGWWL